MNINNLFLDASFIVQSIIILLFVFSIYSWTIIIQKIKQFKLLQNNINQFERNFNETKDLRYLYDNIANDKEKGILFGKEKLFFESLGFYLQRKNNNSTDSFYDDMHRIMRLTINKELDNLEKNTSYLGLIGSISPYIGLFGTVWGIMNSFFSLGTSKAGTLETVAPGIAEALIATAIGLFTAIPAVMAYSRFSSKITELEQNFNNFVDELTVLLKK